MKNGARVVKQMLFGEMTEREITVQKEVINYLKNISAEGKVGHAYVFCGPRGIGKRTVAGMFAAMLLCGSDSGIKPCGGCTACRLYRNGTNPDFKKVTAENSGAGVDEIRKALSEMIIKPVYSPRKVFVIEDADELTVQAQNSMLKTLEEPPEYAVLVLTASNYNALLETIRSRVTRINLKRNSYSEVRSIIEKHLDNNKESEAIASWSGGVPGKALQMALSPELRAIREKTFEMLEILEEKGLDALAESASFFEENRSNVDIILETMESYYRDIIVATETGNENLLINKDKNDIIFNKTGRHSSHNLASRVCRIADLRRDLKQNANYALSVENMLIRIICG